MSYAMEYYEVGIPKSATKWMETLSFFMQAFEQWKNTSVKVKKNY